jgi:hypothetical protein
MEVIKSSRCGVYYYTYSCWIFVMKRTGIAIDYNLEGAYFTSSK